MSQATEQTTTRQLGRDSARPLRHPSSSREGARALMTDAEAGRAAEAQGVEQQEALRRESEEGERLKRDLAAARSEIDALKAEGARALMTDAAPCRRRSRRSSSVLPVAGQLFAHWEENHRTERNVPSHDPKSAYW